MSLFSPSKISMPDFILPGCIALYGFFLRCRMLAGRDLWGDEVFQFNNSAGPFKPFWGHYNYCDLTSFPGEYLLTYPFIQTFGLNKWGLAIPHILLTVWGYYLLYRLCKRFFPTSGGTIITFLVVSLNYNLTYHAFEFRPYAVLPVLAVGALYFADLIINRFDELKTITKVGIGIFFILTAVYHAYGILIVFLPLVFIFLLNRHEGRTGGDKETRRYYLIGILGVATALWSWYASSNCFGLTSNLGFYNAKNTFRYIPNPLTAPVGFLKGIIGNLIGFKPLYFLLAGPVLAVFIRSRARIAQAAFLFLMVILPIALILFVDLRSQYWFLQRQFVWVMPYFAFFLGWTWDTLFIWRKRRHSYNSS